jgi:hypothetical protein
MPWLEKLQAGAIDCVRDGEKRYAGRSQIKPRGRDWFAFERRQFIKSTKPEFAAVHANIRVGQVFRRNDIAVCRHGKVKRLGGGPIGVDGKQCDAVLFVSQAVRGQMQSRYGSCGEFPLRESGCLCNL